MEHIVVTILEESSFVTFCPFCGKSDVDVDTYYTDTVPSLYCKTCEGYCVFCPNYITHNSCDTYFSNNCVQIKLRNIKEMIMTTTLKDKYKTIKKFIKQIENIDKIYLVKLSKIIGYCSSILWDVIPRHKSCYANNTKLISDFCERYCGSNHDNNYVDCKKIDREGLNKSERIALNNELKEIGLKLRPKKIIDEKKSYHKIVNIKIKHLQVYLNVNCKYLNSVDFLMLHIDDYNLFGLNVEAPKNLDMGMSTLFILELMDSTGNLFKMAQACD